MHSVTPESIKQLVQNEDDFGHEMRVGNLLHHIPAFETVHGGTYTDRVSGKPRQFDFRSLFIKENAGVYFAIECKNISPSTPIVICGTHRSAHDSFHQIIDSRVGGFIDKGPTTFIGKSFLIKNSKNTFYKVDDFVGKSILRLKFDGKQTGVIPESDIYDRWSQALSSSADLVDAACFAIDGKDTKHFYSTILPTVVVPDKTLWAVSYGRNGTILGAPFAVNQTELFVNRSYNLQLGPSHRPFYISHVHFCTLTGFNSFINRLAVNDHAWNALFDPNAAEA